MNFADYLLEENGMVLCEPCLCVTLFSDTDLGTPDAPDMLGPYRAFLARFQDRLDFCILDGDQMHAKPVTPERLQNLPNEMQDFKRRKQGGVIADFRHGKSRDELRAPNIEFDYSKIGKPHTFVRACFPLDWFAAHGLAGVNAYLQEALGGFALQAGYVGFCFAWDFNFDREVEPYFNRWLQRHPGIMCPDPAQEIVSIHGLVDIGWITLLGQAFVNKIGGIAALRGAVAHIPAVVVDEPVGGVVSIRIGEQPRLGDTQNGDAMEDYRALGKVLSPLRNRQAIVKGMAVAGLLDREYPGLRAKWIDRFFPE